MTPPREGLLQLVVDGKEMGNPKYDLIERNAKAWDST